MAIHIPGLIAIIIFYLLILGIGIWASRKNKSNSKADSEDMMLAGRNIGIFVGIFTMTATWVGGGYINGSAEVVADFGLLWCQAPFGYGLALIFGGLFFAEKLREKRYATMLDPYQREYGDLMGALLYLPALCGETFWSAAILNALGNTLAVILDLDTNIAIIVSAIIAVLYTILGGLYSVAYTDVVQLICMFIGLWLSVPFALTHQSVESITINATTNWIEPVEPAYIGVYIDGFLLLIFGGIPWQVYFQRVLSSRNVRIAKLLSYAAAVGCAVMVIPAILLGAAGASADWTKTSYPKPEEVSQNWSMILPLVLRYLCPEWVAFIGLGAVSAAVMSSTDSSILSASSMFSRNVFAVIWLRITGRKAKEIAVVWVMRGAQIVIATAATLMAIYIKSIYYLFYLCSDLVYVILFPQLTCVVYFKYSNTYGSLLGFILGLLFRVLGGEPNLGIPPTILFPWYTTEQLFPFKTLSMLISLITILSVSSLTHYLFTAKILPQSMDIFKCFEDKPKNEIEFQEPPLNTAQGKDNPSYNEHPDYYPQKGKSFDLTSN
ncbi:hypothetical protein SNE40_018598 [Patella caerulea]|uniref:High-affinity choline transporter 1 n=1 Tax=Patella caerulea TaxID=87958 RepID=A0AAN8P875_PATCE